MKFKKFNADKCRKDFQRDVEQMDIEQLWQMFKGISIYRNWLSRHTAEMYGASKRISDITEIHRITADELLKRLNKKK